MLSLYTGAQKLSWPCFDCTRPLPYLLQLQSRCWICRAWSLCLPLLQRAAAAVGWLRLFTAAPAWDTLGPSSSTAAFSPAPVPSLSEGTGSCCSEKPCWELEAYSRYFLAFLFLPELSAFRCWGIRLERQETGAASLVLGTPWSLFLPALSRKTSVTD